MRDRVVAAAAAAAADDDDDDDDAWGSGTGTRGGTLKRADAGNLWPELPRGAAGEQRGHLSRDVTVD